MVNLWVSRAQELLAMIDALSADDHLALVKQSYDKEADQVLALIQQSHVEQQVDKPTDQSSLIKKSLFKAAREEAIISFSEYNLMDKLYNHLKDFRFFMHFVVCQHATTQQNQTEISYLNFMSKFPAYLKTKVLVSLFESMPEDIRGKIMFSYVQAVMGGKNANVASLRARKGQISAIEFFIKDASIIHYALETYQEQGAPELEEVLSRQTSRLIEVINNNEEKMLEGIRNIQSVNEENNTFFLNDRVTI